MRVGEGLVIPFIAVAILKLKPMNLQTEINRIEKAQKILECIGSAHNRIRVYKEVDAFLTPIFDMGCNLSENKKHTAAKIQNTKDAIVKLEKHYLKTISNGIDFNTELPK